MEGLSIRRGFVPECRVAAARHVRMCTVPCRTLLAQRSQPNLWTCATASTDEVVTTAKETLSQENKSTPGTSTQVQGAVVDQKRKQAPKSSTTSTKPSAEALKARKFRITGSGKPPPVIKVSPGQNIGSAAAFLKRTIMGDGQALVVCSGDDALWQAFRAMRCARSMLIEDEGTTPVFQPVLLNDAKHGLSAGSMLLYTHKIMNGYFNVSTVLRVSSNSRVEFIASAVVARIKEKGSCVLESFGKVPAVVSIKAIEVARRRMLSEKLDVGVAVDPVVVEIDREDIGATMMNRFVLLACAPRDPTNLRVKVDMRLRSE